MRAIRAIGAPEGDEREVEAILAATEDGIAAIEAIRAACSTASGWTCGAPSLAAATGSQQCGSVGCRGQRTGTRLGSSLDPLPGAAALTIAACGDDDDPEPQPLASGATGAIGEARNGDMAAFIAPLTGLRAGRQGSADKAEAQYPEGPPTGNAAAKFAEDVVIPNLQAQHDAIAQIRPPEGEEDAIASLLDEFQAGIDELAEDPENFVASTALEDAAAEAQALGLKKWIV